MASGDIIDEGSLTTFLGGLNLAIETNQDNAATTVNEPTLQQVINAAESRVKSKLAQWFAIPFTVATVAIKSASGTIALPLLQAVAHQYAGFLLNKWRAIQSVANQEAGVASIDQVARAWERWADDELDRIIAWAMGDNSAPYIDLDFKAGVTRGLAPGTFQFIPVQDDRLCFDEWAWCWN